MASIYFSVDIRRPKVGTELYPIKLWLTHRELSVSLKMKKRFYSSLEHWDESKAQLRRGHPNSKRANFQLTSDRAKFMEAMEELERMFDIKQFHVTEVKNMLNEIVASKEDASRDINLNQDKKLGAAINGSQSNSMGLKLFSCGLKTMKNYSEPKSRDWIRDGVAAIIKFNGKKDILMTDITVQFLKKLEEDHLDRGNNLNGLAAYLSAIRKVFNYTAGTYPNLDSHYPFGRGRYSIKTDTTPVRSVDVNVIEGIRTLKIDPTTDSTSKANWKAQQYALFMYNCRGMNFKDVAKLRKSNIQKATYKKGLLEKGMLDFRRSKNGKKFHFPLTKEATQILNNFNINQLADSDHIFPIGYEKTDSGHATYCTRRKRYNARMTALATMAGFDSKVTTYVLRYTFANELKKNDVPDNAIQDILGHDDPRVTQLYLREHEADKLNDYVSRVV